MPVARIVERQPHVLEKAKIHEQAEWGKYGNTVLTERTKANIYHKVHTGLRIYHYHTDHLGTPQELTNDRGDVVWLNYSLAWGGSFDKLNNVDNLDGLDVSADELQPIRFQGQFFDSETNLHYNRFRYYDSDVGMFISRDPIGLMGGNNVFQYAPNPTDWIDPFGLAKSKKSKKQHTSDDSDSGGIHCSMQDITVADAQALPVIKPNTKEWEFAKKKIQAGGKKGVNYRVSNLQDAISLVNSRSGMNKMPRYTSVYNKGYEIHPSEASTGNAPHNNLAHISWKDWSKKAKLNNNCGFGHIFFDDKGSVLPLRPGE